MQCFTDHFRRDRPQGQVVGGVNEDGIKRQGVDVEKVIGIDHGALRIRPLVGAGWGRCGLVYGQYERESGLTFAVCALNGHNTSQAEHLGQSLVRRLGRWAKGSEAHSMMHNLFAWLRHGNKRQLAREIRRWIWLNRQAPQNPLELDENLMLGWFDGPVPLDYRGAGNCFVMHASGPENGELWVNACKAPLPALRSVQNLPIYYIVVLRECGAAYYAASMPQARGLPGFPMMRPLAIDAVCEANPVYPGLYQSVLGQIGFRVDTRVYRTQVARLPELAQWFGTAHAAAMLQGRGQIADVSAEVGGDWTVYDGSLLPEMNGEQTAAAENLVMLDPGVATGLLHAVVGLEPGSPAAGLAWRFQDCRNHWRLVFSRNACRLMLVYQGRSHEVAVESKPSSSAAKNNSVQILDDGLTLQFSLNGQLLFGGSIADDRLAESTGVGLIAGETVAGEFCISHFEAHPRELPIPPALDLPSPWCKNGDSPAVADGFVAPAGPLEARKTNLGNRSWRRQIGDGFFDLTGQGSVRVRAGVDKPNPGRTVYLVDWNQPEFADVAVTLTPPGKRRGEGERCRSGLAFWQDKDNHILINTWLDDGYGGASISSFFRLNGVEELYDAVWTNVGDRVVWGQQFRMRVAFDGMCYLVSVNDEPVLFRALSDVRPETVPLKIRGVGLLANWEWGNDTGTVFEDFKALARNLTP